MRDRPRLLLLSGASLVGQNVLACLGSRRDRLAIAAMTSTADEPAAFDYDQVYLGPEIRQQSRAFASRFEEVFEHLAPDLVIPCRDDDVSFLATERARRPALVGRLLCGDAAVADAMLDKLDSSRFSKRLELPFAPTLEATGSGDAARGFAAEHGFPLIAKPCNGFASRGVRLILNLAQLEWACAQADLIVQKYCGDADRVRRAAAEMTGRGLPLFHSLEDTKLSIQATIAPDGAVTGVFASGNRMQFGRSERVHVVDDHEVLATARQWASVFAKAGWRGPLNVQCHRDEAGKLTIYEYNGRFTGATAARQCLGFDEVGLILRDWLGLAIPAVPRSNPREVIRYLVGRAMDEESAACLRSTGHWAKR